MFRASILALFLSFSADAFQPAPATRTRPHSAFSLSALPSDAESSVGRRDILAAAASAAFLCLGAAAAPPAFADAGGAADLEGGLDVNSFLRSGMVSQPMGVSGQAGKSRPETGVVLRDGTDASRDSRSGGVLAEIVVKKSGEPMAVLATFESPWSLAKGTVFDVECRDAKTGDGAFLAVTSSTKGQSLADLPNSFFLDRLFSSTGRFSFYGSPTDIKVKSSKMEGPYRFIELGFSNLSQSTNAEIPRKAVLAATIPEGADEAVMLIGSASAAAMEEGFGGDSEEDCGVLPGSARTDILENKGEGKD
eukprot:CAMPEP_0113542966 /NCGR_PEP_ID=MMETSP0015_2-20120614/9903_1 /TAXON_ID=2838 /ORGANISM="Odontella" /LENGTH=306 /DNA_ID=CAMNT_0000443087 /DNA_START=213 /DNA_END=1132 /DNA_ORIENTATION=- /assembly_acc=CAM_ASM_000160